MGKLASIFQRTRGSGRPAVRAAGVVSLVWLTVSLVPPAREWLAAWSYDLLHLVLPRQTPPEAVIIRMDETSLLALQQKDLAFWDRALHARLVDRLREAGVPVIVFDIYFQPLTNLPPEADAELAAALARHGRVGAARLKLNFEGELGLEGSTLAAPPVEALARHLFEGIPERSDARGFVREPEREFEGLPSLPSLARQAALATGRSNDIPPRTWLRHYGPAGQLVSFSYLAVLEGKFAASLSNRVVFVGGDIGVGTHRGPGHDRFLTPYTRWTGETTPGVEINATAFLNLIRNDWLRRLPPIVEFAGLFVSGVVLAVAFQWLPRRRLWPAAALAAALAVLVGIGGAWLTSVWGMWLMVAAVQVPCALLAGFKLRPAVVAAPAPPPVAATTQPAPAVSAPDTTPVVAGYTLLREIGRGGYGEVWLARDLVGTFRAVKLIRRQKFQDEAPYLREFRGMAAFSPISTEHPGLLPILHISRPEGADFFCYVMEAADDARHGREIRPDTYVPRTLRGDFSARGPLPAVEVIRLGLALGAALEFLHGRRLIHRDLKPANIVFLRGEPRLADIGLVTTMAEQSHPATYLGTVGYIAPEGPGSAAADVYSLGKVLYEAVTGNPVGDFPELPANLDARVDRDMLFALNPVILRCCAPDLRERFATAGELLVALRRLLDAQRAAADDAPTVR